MNVAARGRGGGSSPVADEAAADRGEVGLAVPAEVHQLAVEHDAMVAQRGRELGQLGELGAAVAARPRTERPADRAVHLQLGAQAVPFELHRPVITDASREPGVEEHRLDEPRERLPRGVHPCHNTRAYSRQGRGWRGRPLFAARRRARSA
jgi:hypothetical protein